MQFLLLAILTWISASGRIKEYVKLLAPTASVKTTGTSLK